MGERRPSWRSVRVSTRAPGPGGGVVAEDERRAGRDGHGADARARRARRWPAGAGAAPTGAAPGAGVSGPPKFGAAGAGTGVN